MNNEKSSHGNKRTNTHPHVTQQQHHHHPPRKESLTYGKYFLIIGCAILIFIIIFVTIFTLPKNNSNDSQNSILSSTGGVNNNTISSEHSTTSSISLSSQTFARSSIYLPSSSVPVPSSSTPPVQNLVFQNPQEEFQYLLSNTQHQLYYERFSSNSGTLNCPSRRIYYVDQHNGQDSNSGLTHQLAWKTVEQVESNLQHFLPGDQILFCKANRHFAVYGYYFSFPVTDTSSGCSIKIGSYDCLVNTTQIYPLLTNAFPLPQLNGFNNVIQWIPYTHTLFNGSVIKCVKYNLNTIGEYFQYIPNAEISWGSHLYINGNIADYQNQIPPVLSYPTDYDLPYLGNDITLKQMNAVWHFDPSMRFPPIARNPGCVISDGGNTQTGCTTYYASISPGSWCRNIFYYLFNQNEILYNQTFYPPGYDRVLNNQTEFLVGAIFYYYNNDIFAPILSTIEQVEVPDFSCITWFNEFVVPLGLTWDNHLIDKIVIPEDLWGTENYTPPRVWGGGPIPSIYQTIDQFYGGWQLPFRCLAFQWGFGLTPGSMWSDYQYPYYNNGTLYYYPRSEEEYNALLVNGDLDDPSDYSQVFRNTTITLGIVSINGGDPIMEYSQGNLEIQELEIAYNSGAFDVSNGNLSIHHCIIHDNSNNFGVGEGDGNFLFFNNFIYRLFQSEFNLDTQVISNNTFINSNGFTAGGINILIRNNTFFNTGTFWFEADNNITVELNHMSNCQIVTAQWNCFQIQSGYVHFNNFSNMGNGDIAGRFFGSHFMEYNYISYGINIAGGLAQPVILYGNIFENITFQIDSVNAFAVNNLFVTTDGILYCNEPYPYTITDNEVTWSCFFSQFENNTTIRKTRRRHPIATRDNYPYAAAGEWPFTQQSPLYIAPQGSGNDICFGLFELITDNPSRPPTYAQVTPTTDWQDFANQSIFGGDSYGVNIPIRAPCDDFCEGVLDGDLVPFAQMYYISISLNDYYTLGSPDGLIEFGIDQCNNRYNLSIPPLIEAKIQFQEQTENIHNILTSGFFQNFSISEITANWEQSILQNPYYNSYVPLNYFFYNFIPVNLPILPWYPQ